MPNMGYCRFQNTDKDLADCKDALDDNEANDDDLSDEEKSARDSLIEQCIEIAIDHGHFVGRDIEEAD